MTAKTPPGPYPDYIGVSGYIGSGKSTVAAHLAETCGYVVYGFFDEILEELYASFPETVKEIARHFAQASDPDTVDKMLRADRPAFVRRFLQEFGTEDRRRLFGDDYWTARWIVTVQTRFRGRRVVNPNVRSREECEAVRKLGGVVLRVTRPGTAPAPGAHRTETSLHDNSRGVFDALVTNIGTLEELRQRVDSAILALRRR